MSKNWHRRVIVKPDLKFEPNGGSPFRNHGVDIQRNDPCTCGSGKKFKKCCGNRKENYPTPESKPLFDPTETSVEVSTIPSEIPF